MKAFPNKYPGTCSTCGASVAARAGWCCKGPETGHRFKVFCSTSTCLPTEAQDSAKKAGAPAYRRLTAAGTIEMSDRPTQDELALLRAFPGQKFDWDTKTRSVSLDPVDRGRVLELANKLSLEVAPALLNVEASDLVKDAVARATVGGSYPYQGDGVGWIAPRVGALLADGMGVGKTPQTLWALPKGGRALVVVPASLKWNWHDECLKFRPDLNPIVCTGRKGFRLPKNPGDVIVINYDILPSWLTPKDTGRKDGRGKPIKEAKVSAEAEAVLAKTYLIVDECQAVKNYKAARSKKVTELSKLSYAVWGLTGTPLKNRPLDLWGVLSSLGLNWKVFGSWSGFLRCMGGHKNRWGGYDFAGPSGPETAERLRTVMLRRLKSEVLPELPPKTHRTIRVNGLSKSLQKQLDDAWADYVETYGEASEELPPFEEFSALRKELAASKIEALVEIVETYEESETPLVVFSAHRAPIEALGKREGWVTIIGGMDAKDRNEAVKSFQAGKCKGIALTIGAGGTGLTLTHASNMIFCDLAWTPSENFQAEDRICRIGQESNTVTITRLDSNHVLDRHISGLLAAKAALINKALDGVADKIEVKVDGSRRGAEVVEETPEEFEARIAERKATIEAAAREAEIAEAKDKVARYLAKRNGGRSNAVPHRPLTEEYKATLANATNHMLGRCDGAVTKDSVGFNKPDAAVAHTILVAGLASDNDFRLAEAILTKYHRQLSGTFPALFE